MTTKTFRAILLGTALLAAGCQEYDDSELRYEINDLKTRVTALEALRTTVSGLQQTIDALEAGDYVTDYTPITDEDGNTIGYTVKFKTHDPITLYNGTSPLIGVQAVDGVYYWTVNGEFVEDADGEKVPVQGKSPQFRITNGNWEVSFDGGTSWEAVETSGETSLLTITENDDNVIFTFNDGSTILLPKEKAFRIRFGMTELKNFEAPTRISFFIDGVAADEVDNVVIFAIGDGNWSGEVEVRSRISGMLTVTAEDEYKAGKVYVIASNGNGKTDVKAIALQGGLMTGVLEVNAIGQEGGEIALTLSTTYPEDSYEVAVEPQSAKSWITVAKKTKAERRTDELTVHVKPNTTGGYRYATLTVLSGSNVALQQFDLLQSPDMEGTTALSSLSGIPENKEIQLVKLFTAAASGQSAVVTDGVSYLLATAANGQINFAAGDSLTLTGKIIADEKAGVRAFEVTEKEVLSSGHKVTHPQEATLYLSSSATRYTKLIGVVSAETGEEDGVSSYTVKEETRKDGLSLLPSEGGSLDLSGLAGKRAYLKGYAAGLEMFVTEVRDYALTESAQWTLSYDGEVSSGASEGHPEQITVQAAGDAATPYYSLSLISQSDLDKSYSGDIIAYLYSEAVAQANVNTYRLSLGYPIDEPAYPNATRVEAFEKFDYGVHYACVFGFDDEGFFNGKYACLQFTKEDPSVQASYEDFLGEWTISVDNLYNNWRITEKEAGKTYTLTGIEGLESLWMTGQEGSRSAAVEAVYDAESGSFSVSPQELGRWEHTESGLVVDSLLGCLAFRYNIARRVKTLFTAKMMPDGTIELRPGSTDTQVRLAAFHFYGIIPGTRDYYTYTQTITKLPNVLTKTQEASEAYKKWIGTWTIERNDYKTDDQGEWTDEFEVVTDTWIIRQTVPNKQYSISGIERVDDIYGTAVAKFDAGTGNLAVDGQLMQKWISNGSTVDEYLAGIYANLDENGHPIDTFFRLNGTIFSASLNADGKATLTPSEAKPNVPFISFQRCQAPGRVRYYHLNGYALPNTMTQVAK